MSRSRRIWLYGIAIAGICTPAAAQTGQGAPNFGSNGLYREDPASELARYLRMVTANPRNLEALTGAGRAALDVGDAQAAIGFYARAEAIAPRNGRVKAGLGSALVMLNQEQAALRYFDEATDLGVPEADIASDRGLAYDLRGSAKRAQRDYGIALKRGDDAETTRRLALSMAITGDGNGALVLLDPLLRKQDTAAWRARAFILAMTGDATGANKAAEAVMPASTAAGFAPFFRKLPSLRPGEKAAAVHFGHFPGENRPMRIDDLFNQAEVAARVALENTPRSATDAGRVDSSQGAFGRLASRSPNDEGQLAARLAPRPVADVRPIATPRLNATPALRPSNDARIAAALTPAPQPVRVAPIASQPVRVAPVPTPAPIFVPAPAPVPVPAPAPTPATTAIASPISPASPAVTIAKPVVGSGPTPLPGFGPVLAGPQPNLGASTRLADVAATIAPLVQSVELPPSTIPGLPTASDQTPAPATRLAGIAGILAGTRTAPTPAPIATTIVPPAPRPKVEAAVPVVPPPSKPKVETASAAPVASAPPTAAAVEESRVWVQVAGGADERALPLEWRRLKGKAPELLNAQTAWTTPLKATNRLLVGPFASEREAQEFVNKLKPKGITAFTWTSAKDQAVAKLAAR